MFPPLAMRFEFSFAKFNFSCELSVPQSAREFVDVLPLLHGILFCSNRGAFRGVRHVLYDFVKIPRFLFFQIFLHLKF